MKIRSGFISNSSSASFIIGLNSKYKTVYSVAKAMMNDLISQGFDNFAKELATLEKYKKNPDTPVFFPTSDGTYIRKVGDLIIVSSTHHYEPSIFEPYFVKVEDIDKKLLKNLEYKTENYYQKNKGDIACEVRKYKIKYLEDFDYFWKKYDDFVILNHDVVGVHEYIDTFKHPKFISDGETCKFCGRSGFRSGIRIGNHIYCDCTDSIKALHRKQKLEKINENKKQFHKQQ